MKKNMIFILFCIILFLSCSSSQFGWKSGSEKPEDNSTLIEDFDPLSLDDDDIIVTPKESQVEVGNQAQGGSDLDPAAVPEKEIVQIPGYRVQLLSTKQEYGAWEAKKEAILKFEEDIHLVHEASLYKLRVGDCRTRGEAEALVEKAVRKGFREAWIVRTKINVRKSELPGL